MVNADSCCFYESCRFALKEKFFGSFFSELKMLNKILISFFSELELLPMF